ncbi:hypothetical protein ACTXT7_002987 [Hymenolepis weldensis]
MGMELNNWIDHHGEFAYRCTSSLRITNDAREDEMDQNMQEVAGMIGNLRNMAIDMGSEITQQNTQVERIHLKAKANADRIKKANEQASKLLK